MKGLLDRAKGEEATQNSSPDWDMYAAIVGFCNQRWWRIRKPAAWIR